MNTRLEDIKALLREAWDPLGMMPHLPLDEYDRYAIGIWGKLQAGASSDEIFDYLVWAIETQFLEEAIPERERAVAEAAVHIRDVQNP